MQMYGADSQINWWLLFIGVTGGMAVFLLGMGMMGEELKGSAGAKIKSVLKVMTYNNSVGIVAGTFFTALMQSCTAMSVVLITFVQAELMHFRQTLAVLLGAGIAATFTTQLIAFKLSDYVLIFVAIGFFLNLLAQRPRLKSIGRAIMGFGLLFFGMTTMILYLAPLKQSAAFLALVEEIRHPVIGVLVGLVITGLIHSSGAFTGLLIAMASQNLISFEVGVALSLGSNIGTTVTGFLASINTSRAAKRVALSNTLYRTLGVLFVLTWLNLFEEGVLWIGNFFEASIARNIANAHTLFNVLLAIIYLPLIPLFNRLMEFILPDQPKSSSDQIDAFEQRLNYLDNNLMVNPSMAIDLARQEILVMMATIERMVDQVIIPFLNKSDASSNQKVVRLIHRGEEQIDFLVLKINDYLVQIGRQSITSAQTTEIFSYMSLINDMESVADILQKSLLPLLDKKEGMEAHFSTEGQAEISAYHIKVKKQLSRLRAAFTRLDFQMAENSLRKMENYLNLEHEFRVNHLKRLQANRTESIQTHEIHMELMDYLKQINVYMGNIAKSIREVANLHRPNKVA